MQQFELTHEFLSQLEELIDAGNKTEVSKQIAGLHPADIAEILEELNNERAQFVFLLLDNEKAGDVLAEIDEEERVHFIESFPAETIARRFIDNMDSDDAADLVASMPNEQQHEVLSHMEDLEQAGDIVDLLHYDEDTAGGLMAKELVMVNENWTVLTCLREVSRQAENLDEIYNIYVVDDDNKLKGRLSLKKMITAPTSQDYQFILSGHHLGEDRRTRRFRSLDHAEIRPGSGPGHRPGWPARGPHHYRRCGGLYQRRSGQGLSDDVGYFAGCRIFG